jgi:mRNA interferase RelE/StbE
MEFYSVILQPSVHKDLRRLPKSTAVRAMELIEGLAEGPRPRQSVKLSGAEHLYRLRLGDYRIVYELDGGRRQVTVYYVRHRSEIYRVL